MASARLASSSIPIPVSHRQDHAKHNDPHSWADQGDRLAPTLKRSGTIPRQQLRTCASYSRLLESSEISTYSTSSPIKLHGRVAMALKIYHLISLSRLESMHIGSARRYLTLYTRANSDETVKLLINVQLCRNKRLNYGITRRQPGYFEGTLQNDYSATASRLNSE